MSKPVVYHGIEKVQNLDFDLFAAVHGNVMGPHPVLVAQPIAEHEPVFGIIRKPPELPKLGTRREPQPYRYINGKRYANRGKRFGRL